MVDDKDGKSVMIKLHTNMHRLIMIHIELHSISDQNFFLLFLSDLGSSWLLFGNFFQFGQQTNKQKLTVIKLSLN